MPNIYEVAAAFSRQLLARERITVHTITHAYGGVWRRIRSLLDTLERDIKTATTRGETVNRGWLERANRLRLIELQVERIIRDTSAGIAPTIEAAQIHAAILANDATREMIQLQLPEVRAGVEATFVRVPREAITHMIGTFQQGSPLRVLLDALGPEAAAHVRETLVEGMALGYNPRKIARQIRDDVDDNRTRALAIARTEVMRSYRQASMANYEANADVVAQWVWHAKLDKRTCAFCWSMHGTIHKLGDPMASHVNCRCSPIPKTKTYRELGIDIDEPDRTVEPGVIAFKRIPHAEKLAILGPSKLRAYQAGAITLEDVRSFATDAKWGRVGHERSLDAILGERKAAKWKRRA